MAGSSTRQRAPIALYRAAMTRFALQFGQTQSGLTYIERVSAYGVCARGEAHLAIAQIGKGGSYEYDLQAGASKPMRMKPPPSCANFEETGLTIWPTRA